MVFAVNRRNFDLLVVSPEFGYGGVGIHTFKIVNFLLEQGFRVNVHTTGKSKKKTSLYHPALRIERINVSLPGFDKFSPLFELWSSIHARFEKPRLIIRPLPPFYFNIPYVSNAQVPEIVIVHDTFASLISAQDFLGRGELKGKLLSSRLGKALQKSEKTILERANIIVAVSEYTKKKLTDVYGLNEKKVHVIYNPIDTRVFRRKTPDEITSEIGNKLKIFKGRNLLAVSVLRPEIVKNPKLLFDTVAELHRRRVHSIKFVVVGINKNSEYIKKYMQKSDCDDILFLGPVDNNLLPDVYSLSDFLIVTSASENLPTILLEAMACGTVPVCTNVGGIPEVVRDHENGFLVYSKTKDEFVGLLMKLFKDKHDELSIVSQNAVKSVSSKFENNLIKKSYLDLVNGLT